jgi:HEAT repeat protein
VNSEECFALFHGAARPDGESSGRILPGEFDAQARALSGLASGFRNKPETQAALLEAIADRDPRVRKHGLTALSRSYLRDPFGAVPPPIAAALLARLDDEIDVIGSMAAHVLSRQVRGVAPVAVPLLVRKLSSPNVSTRAWSADALREFDLEADAALPALRTLADGPGEDGPDLIAARKAIEAITAASRTFHEQTLPNLIAELSHDDPDLRAGAAATIAQSGPRAKAAIPELTRSLGDREPKVRRCASKALKAIGATLPESANK